MADCSCDALSLWFFISTPARHISLGTGFGMFVEVRGEGRIYRCVSFHFFLDLIPALRKGEPNVVAVGPERREIDLPSLLLLFLKHVMALIIFILCVFIAFTCSI